MTKQPANEIDARELALYATNDGDLYRQRAQPIMLNLARKMVARPPAAWHGVDGRIAQDAGHAARLPDRLPTPRADAWAPVFDVLAVFGSGAFWFACLIGGAVFAMAATR